MPLSLRCGTCLEPLYPNAQWRLDAPYAWECRNELCQEHGKHFVVPVEAVTLQEIDLKAFYARAHA